MLDRNLTQMVTKPAVRKSILIAAAASTMVATPLHAQDADEVEALSQQIAQLTAQLAQVSARLDEVEDEAETQQQAVDTLTSQAAAPVSETPTVSADMPTQVSMGAAPEVESDDGFSFKPFGRLCLMPDGPAYPMARAQMMALTPRHAVHVSALPETFPEAFPTRWNLILPVTKSS